MTPIERVAERSPFQLFADVCAFLGKADLARRHYEEALSIGARADLQQSRARTQAAYAGLLIGRGEDLDHARQMLTECLGVCRSLDLKVLTERARRLLECCDRAADVAVEATREDAATVELTMTRSTGDCDDDALPEVVEIRCKGSFWNVRRKGRDFLLPDLVGLRYLRILIEAPGEQWWTYRPPPLENLRRRRGGPGGTVCGKCSPYPVWSRRVRLVQNSDRCGAGTERAVQAAA